MTVKDLKQSLNELYAFAIGKKGPLIERLIFYEENNNFVQYNTFWGPQANNEGGHNYFFDCLTVYGRNAARRPMLSAAYSTADSISSASEPSPVSNPKTAIVMLNMGGPKTTDQVGDYLHRIMTDRDMIQLPVQGTLGPWIATRRTEEVKKKYEEIGGGSPILRWTDTQGRNAARRPMLSAAYSTADSISSASEPSPVSNPKTAIVMLNMGGPKTTDQVGDYLHRIMTDRDMIQLPVQGTLGPWIATRRTEEVKKKYEEIGGGSPILRWTDTQGRLLVQALDGMFPAAAPHKHYVAFRYVPPFTQETFEQLERDGVERAIIFSQYPQYSCATTGSSLNAIADFYKNRKIPRNIKFSLIERWASHPLLADVFAERIREELEKFDSEIRDDVLILFTAHSLPLKAVSRGDTYPHEVAATVAACMRSLRAPNAHRLVWQSKVGPLPWLQPYTDDAIKAYAKQGRKHLILVPIAFVNEHIETLHELDIEYCEELAKEAGVIQIERAAAPNDHPIFIQALADIVANHIQNGPALSRQFTTRCPQCVSARCKASKEFFKRLCGTPESDRSDAIVLN